MFFFVFFFNSITLNLPLCNQKQMSKAVNSDLKHGQNVGYTVCCENKRKQLQRKFEVCKKVRRSDSYTLIHNLCTPGGGGKRKEIKH